MNADTIIEELNMQPHPEGGWYVETFRAAEEGNRRAASTAIYYLLQQGERSHWHRVLDADEVWHWYAGGPLRLKSCVEGGPVEETILGNDFTGGQRPQAVIPHNVWQAAEPLGDWVLVGCTVAPGFDFRQFEMAPRDWSPEEG
ncbi:cupin domain-containing protein [Aestuariispira ectoiniformans]|uniref:cupin domain-containing protein n=1 Tax=Aestuariispira ectoiniformans TaxID=2775080 RepID=UPI00223AF0E5|nr:cupin domain-containing protein [Aestuariispira ectoiniformans]